MLFTERNVEVLEVVNVKECGEGFKRAFVKSDNPTSLVRLMEK